MGGLSSKPTLVNQLQALLNSGSLTDVKSLYYKAKFALKDASVSTKEKEKIKGLINEMVKRFKKSYKKSSCSQIEIVVKDIGTCYNVDDLTEHWNSQNLKWVDPTRSEYPSVYTIPNLDGHTILQEDVDRLLRYYSQPSPAPIKWFLMPRPAHSKVQVYDGESTKSRKLCMLIPSGNPGQQETEDALKSLIEAGNKPFRTNEALWKKIKRKVIAEEVAGTAAGAWSARKAQLAVKRY